MSLRPGLTGRASLVVGQQDTAAAMRSGDVPALATPRVVALCEEAACAAVAGLLPEGHTSVGNGVQFNHLAPTPVGGRVTAEATLEKVEGRRLGFTVSVTDGDALVGAGRVSRVVVETERFLQKLEG